MMILIRCLMALLLLWMIFSKHTWVWSVYHLIWLTLLLYLMCFDITEVAGRWLKSWRLLRWIILPTFILHAVFSPGEMIFSFLPLSYEGMLLGLSLSLHLCEIFIMALLLAQLFPMYIWFNMLSKVKCLEIYLQVYGRLMPRLLLEIRVLIRRAYRHWRQQSKKLVMLPHALAQLTDAVEFISYARALRVWKTWHEPISLKLEATQTWSYLLYIALILGVIFEYLGGVWWS